MTTTRTIKVRVPAGIRTASESGSQAKEAEVGAAARTATFTSGFM